MGDADVATATRAAETPRVSIQRRLFAWSVHLLTATGVVWCLLALHATYRSDWRAAFAWLSIAVLVDAIDGTLARMASVKSVLPEFDGTLLDNIVDFANYVIVPAWIMHRAALLPESLSFAAVSAICLASTYQFCQEGAKTPDHYFKGFPSYWNLAALYLLAMNLNPAVNLAIVLTFVVLVFIPIKYVYVTRTKPFRTISIVLTCVWGAVAVLIVVQLPDPHSLLIWISWAYFAYYWGLSLYLTLTTRRTTL